MKQTLKCSGIKKPYKEPIGQKVCITGFGIEQLARFDVTKPNQLTKKCFDIGNVYLC